MTLSIIIPAYNESAKIAADISAAGDFLVKAGTGGTVIVVDDGSDDGTADIASACDVPAGIDLKVISYSPNRGKGFAVRQGVAQAKTDFILFIDAGHCIPYENILAGLELLRQGECPIVHASRKMAGSDIAGRPTLSRRFSSFVFTALVRRLFRLPASITDTQCGCKLYRADVARNLFGRAGTDGFMFDIEIIALAMRQGLQIREIPIRWFSDRDSRLSLFRHTIPSIIELFRIRKRLKSRS